MFSPVKSEKQRPAVQGKVKREEHKIFDEVKITVRSGNGGAGEVTEAGKGRMVPNFKYRPGGNMLKQIFLPNGDPSDGANGGNVLLVVDPALDSLLHLHNKSTIAAKHGGNGNPADGSRGALSRDRVRAKTSPLRIPVPPGTVVKRKRGGQLLGELINPGDSLVVAYGGRGGPGIKKPSQQTLQKQRTQRRFSEEEEGIVEDDNYKQDAAGLPGEEVTLQLLLRVVADVGIVGLPNAGKSSLLSAMTRASPEIAPYPFTTLMPNLGVMQTGGEAEEGRGRQAILADMPGLIEGAHQGRGLGRMFLRHLRRTRVILHVVDATAADPATDYWAVREELRMYNPEYCTRPHVVVLNKMDLADANELRDEISIEVMAVATRLQADNEGELSLPSAIVCVSAMEGSNLEGLNAALEPLLFEPGSELSEEDELAGLNVLDW
ncbi:hypothetical protein WJX72_002780 [[Myrmecia] bisecta]|uniref:Uncharacterized protein n=1 Tax=[Myrmecia] bisecta TaxID=41462 RepID=A0AAW1PW90_9CHLO